MARRPERWSDRWAIVLVLTLATAMIAALCVAQADGDFGEFTGRFSVLFGLSGLMVGLTLLEKRSRDRAYEAAWQSVCHVLVGEHSHDGIVLTGTWKGRPFGAVANAYMPGPNTGIIEEAERRAIHLRRDIRLSFRPKTSDVAYEDGSGEPSCAADLVVHLDLVRRAVDVHATAMASNDARHDSS